MGIGLITKEVGINKTRDNPIDKHDLLNDEGMSFFRRNSVAGICDIIIIVNETRATLARLSGDESSLISIKEINKDRAVIGVIAITPINNDVNIKYHFYLYKATLLYKTPPFKKFLLKKYKQKIFTKVVIANKAHMFFEVS
ncbi:hypothetical protein LU631_11470 [Erwinia tracheiphila]|uniref:Uncharacterized protein n=1 Tax=Erwinia tracheiphila TaxID=65700 RepID=A0A0M2K842_9GAMM|nr:hypothetical protein [Erwinia tracheiphila]EOS93710.1 hypothetical protein ETR_17654 [Erwinia tracheiphila PSU-1]KKF35540.1 hypothetical protein SY86_09035 [Erwinia tracheiphila]UIA89714.1 hypothetical protein LU631_11470 [Erwinia tracheiphila]UIA98014.1 hypothetical protein LU633_09680 [Erwinia tracheiphila]